MTNSNNWYVVTGAPCSGKTTTLEYLEKRGKTIYYEWARIYIDEQMKIGKTLQEIRKDEIGFQKIILQLKIDFEKKLDKNSLVFMERGIPDTTAYLNLLKYTIDSKLKKDLSLCNYKKVFLLEILDYKIDYARTETAEEAKILEDLLEKSYTDLGLDVVRVPTMSVKKRSEFILNNL